MDTPSDGPQTYLERYLMTSTKKKFKILITGAGAPGTSGTIFSLKSGAASESVDLELIGADMRLERTMATEFSSLHEVPAPESSDYLPSITALADSHEIDLVVPQTTRENLVLSAAGQRLKTLTAPADTIRLANDKLKLTKLFSSIGLGAPNFRSADSVESLVAAVTELGYPANDVVVKLTNGNGGRGVRIVSARLETFREFSENKPDGMRTSLDSLVQTLKTAELFPILLVSEVLSAPEVTVDVYAGKSGFVSVPRFRDEIRAGISVRSTIFQDDSLSRTVATAVKEIGLNGAFGFQFMKRGSTFCVIECNPRIQGTMVASIMSGNNIIWLAVRDALGLPGQVRLNKSWSHGQFQRTWGGELRWNNQLVRI